MATILLIGAQWGDEGKGKIIDALTDETDIVVRFQGGNNAGHTVEIGERKFVLHLIPSGILRPDKQCVIGNGLVVDPVALVEEIEMLEGKGVAVRDRLLVDGRAQLVFSHHRLRDAAREGGGSGKIGTTLRGIGPAYEDKARRTGIRAVDLRCRETLEARLRERVAEHNHHFRDDDIAHRIDADAEWERVSAVADLLAPLVTDTVYMLNRAVSEGRGVLLEGAQGTWLDIDYGTYPYVTSSNTTAGGACTGAGLPPRAIDRVLGVVKAYTTRVGNGPFPTELDDDAGERLREAGGEFGATTGRPRRCGWLDAVACRFAVMVNGIDDLAITKLDVLDDHAEIAICTGYELDGRTIDQMPIDAADIGRVKPVYEWHPGWQTRTTEARCWDDLPDLAQRYLERVAELLGARIGMVSTGPRRAQFFRV